jgi:ectoine hydroxylase-related dioxygenase (phytanoyl-CoA dioxygenase family)
MTLRRRAILRIRRHSERRHGRNEAVSSFVANDQIEAFAKDGAVVIPGLFREWVSVIEAGIERNLNDRGPYASESVSTGGPGSFFDDYCNWRRIPEFRELIEHSPVAEAAARLMRSDSAQFFHDHVLVKEPGTQKPTPWHQDSPYYFIDGNQTVSFWIPIDPVQEATLRLIAGSHQWPQPVRPVRWLNDANFYETAEDYLPVPDPDVDTGLRVVEWPVAPGDAVAFHYKTVHGARGNLAATRRRVLSLRWVGDDARYVERPGRTSPPYPGHGMRPGQRLREDWFPILWPKIASGDLSE